MFGHLKIIFNVLITFVEVNSFAMNTCGEKLVNQNVLQNNYPEVVDVLKEKVSSGQINPEDMHFILLPGNMGDFWKSSNHNIGYDLLKDLASFYGATGSKDGSVVGSSTAVRETFNTKDTGDDTDFIDAQTFYSESPYARTTSGEIFYVTLESEKTLVFMRRYGFYNDGSNFFVPVINEIGGNTENIIVLHDDLHTPVKEFVVFNGDTPYNGNRAILSLHNNLNALRLYKSLDANKGNAVKILIESLDASSLSVLGEVDLLIDRIKKITWRMVVEVKNTFDPIQFLSGLSKLVKPELLSFYESQLKGLKSEVQEELDLIRDEQMKLSAAEDKRAAGMAFREFKTGLISSSPRLAQFYKIEELVKDLKSKKSAMAVQFINLFAEGFDPRAMSSSFSSIGVGTGYKAWVENGRLNGFPEISEVLGDTEEGSYPHFVLSQRDSYFDNDEFLQRVIRELNLLIGIGL